MPFTENRRVRYYRKNSDGSLTDTGWDLVEYANQGAYWEPVDTILARGFNGTGKTLTGVTVADDITIAGTPLNSNVFYPRTGTAAA